MWNLPSPFNPNSRMNLQIALWWIFIFIYVRPSISQQPSIMMAAKIKDSLLFWVCFFLSWGPVFDNYLVVWWFRGGGVSLLKFYLCMNFSLNLCYKTWAIDGSYFYISYVNDKVLFELFWKKCKLLETLI